MGGDAPFEFKHLFYLANIIDYFRIYFLYLAVQEMGYMFALFYSVSYLLDAVDGIAARALNQCSKLGYYLDMVIDRMSSITCLVVASEKVQRDYPEEAVYVVPLLYFAIVFCEIMAHGIVVYYSEVKNVHQKEMGHDYMLVKLYLDNKTILFCSCAGFELCMLSVIVNEYTVSMFFVPWFLFRIAANLTRLFAVIKSQLVDSGKTD